MYILLFGIEPNFRFDCTGLYLGEWKGGREK